MYLFNSGALVPSMANMGLRDGTNVNQGVVPRNGQLVGTTK